MKAALLLALYCGICAGQNPFTAGVGKGDGVSPTSRPASRKKKPATAAAVHKTLPAKRWTMKTRRGTWMNLDLSPDGKQLVFELLGHLYLLPSRGGKATALTKGASYNSQPRFSPDGRKIVFVSDRSGCKSLWLMNTDGTNPEILTRSKWVVLNLPAWSPDGRYVVYRKRITDSRSVGTVALWMQHIMGGKGIRLTNRKRIGDANSPAFSHDGRFVYFASRGRHRYNRNPHTGIWNVQRLELRTMKRLLISRNASKPLPSPNGRWVSYLRRRGSRTALLLQDLKSGRERVLTNALDFDQQEGFAMSGTYPNYAWSRDSRFLIFTAKGTFWRLNVRTGKSREIPFSATIRRNITNALHFQQSLPRNQFQVKILRWPSMHPKQRWMIWSSLGQIWRAPWPSLSPVKPVTQGPELHYAPSFSRDGKAMLYVSWSDRRGGHIWKRDITPTGTLGPPQRLTETAGQYLNPVFTPKGHGIVYVVGSGAWSRGLSLGSEPWLQLRWRSLKSKRDHLVTRLRNRGALSRTPLPQVSLDGQRVFFTRRSYKGYKSYTALHSIRLDGTDEKQHVRVYAGEELRLSPDQKWVALRHLHEIYLTPLPSARSKAIDLGLVHGHTRGTKLPVLHLSKKASGNWPFWTADNHIGWLSGPTLSLTPFAKVLRRWQEKNSAHSKKFPLVSTRLIPQKAKVAKPSGLIALTNLSIPALKGGKSIERGTILIQNNRILAVRPSSQFQPPPGARVVDLRGKVAIPGLIDVHAHMHYGALSIHPQQHWAYKVNLAYGVTTIHDPSASTELVFSYAERVRAGLMIGPRVFSTGFILYGAENSHKAHIRNYKHALRHIRRLKAQGAISVKSYMQPSRQQRQWVLQAALKEKILVYPEGGGYLEMNLSMVLDGHTGIEHALPVAPLYPDVIQLMAQSKTGYTPTLLVGYGGIWGENYFYQQAPIWNDPRLRKFVPARRLRAKTLRRTVLVMNNDWHHKRVAAAAKQIVRAGGKVQIGSHGQLQGLGFHWEMKALSQGGLSNREVLKAATLDGAYYLGLEKELGSIEPGKLADILILNKDPLKKIEHAKDIHWIVHNGVVRQPSTLRKVFP